MLKNKNEKEQQQKQSNTEIQAWHNMSFQADETSLFKYQKVRRSAHYVRLVT